MLDRSLRLLEAGKRSVDHYVSGMPYLLPVLILLYTSLILSSALYMNNSHFQAESFPVELPSLAVLVFAYVAVFLPLPFFSRNIRRPSYVIVWYAYFVIYIPTMLMMFLTFGFKVHQIPTLATIFVGMTLLASIHRIPLAALDPGAKTVKESLCQDKIGRFWIFLVFSALLFVAIIHAYVGVSFDVHSFDEVYKVRAAYSSQLARLSGLETRVVAYSVRWFYLIVMPAFLAVGFVYRDRRSVLFAIVGLLMIYSLTAYKSALFILVAFLVLWVCLSGDTRLFPVYTLSGLSFFMVSSIAVDAFTGIYRPLTLVRRFIITPGVHVSYYYEFFRDKPLVLLSDRVFGKLFFEYPFDGSVPFLIGEHFFDDPGRRVNANLWATGYASFDVLGILLFSVIMIGLLWLYDSASQNLNVKFTGVLLTGYVMTFANSGPIVAILTNGFAFLILVGVLLPRSEATQCSPDP
jgi:hypothetical protein